MPKQLMGVCCNCQSSHPVINSPDGLIMDEHDVPHTNMSCNGVGTTPQWVFGVKVEQRTAENYTEEDTLLRTIDRDFDLPWDDEWDFPY